LSGPLAGSISPPPESPAQTAPVRRSCLQRRNESEGSGARPANAITREWAPA